MHAVTPEMNAAFLPKIPMVRFCKPEEVAAMIAFLLSDDLSFTPAPSSISAEGGPRTDRNGFGLISGFPVRLGEAPLCRAA